MAESAEVDGMALAPLDTWLPYRWETGQVFDLAEGCMKLLRKRPFHGHGPLNSRTLPARAVCFAVDRLLFMHEACAKI